MNQVQVQVVELKVGKRAFQRRRHVRLQSGTMDEAETTDDPAQPSNVEGSGDDPEVIRLTVVFIWVLGSVQALNSMQRPATQAGGGSTSGAGYEPPVMEDGDELNESIAVHGRLLRIIRARCTWRVRAGGRTGIR